MSPTIPPYREPAVYSKTSEFLDALLDDAGTFEVLAHDSPVLHTILVMRLTAYQMAMGVLLLCRVPEDEQSKALYLQAHCQALIRIIMAAK